MYNKTLQSMSLFPCFDPLTLQMPRSAPVVSRPAGVGASWGIHVPAWSYSMTRLQLYWREKEIWSCLWKEILICIFFSSKLIPSWQLICSSVIWISSFYSFYLHILHEWISGFIHDTCTSMKKLFLFFPQNVLLHLLVQVPVYIFEWNLLGR